MTIKYRVICIRNVLVCWESIVWNKVQLNGSRVMCTKSKTCKWSNKHLEFTTHDFQDEKTRGGNEKTIWLAGARGGGGITNSAFDRFLRIRYKSRAEKLKNINLVVCRSRWGARWSPDCCQTSRGGGELTRRIGDAVISRADSFIRGTANELSPRGGHNQ